MRSSIGASLIFCSFLPAAALAQQLTGMSASYSPATLPALTAATAGFSSSVPENAKLPEGISLPRSGMIHAIDVTSDGATLVQLHPTEIASNSHAAGNVLRAQVYAGPHSSVELKGLNAATHLQSAGSTFLVRLTSDDPELLRGRIHLIRLQQTKDRRVVATFSQNIFGGQHSKKYDDVAVTKVDIEPDTWLKVTPDVPLTPGEYGIAIMPKDPNLFPDVVYDFDVNYAAATPEK